MKLVIQQHLQMVVQLIHLLYWLQKISWNGSYTLAVPYAAVEGAKALYNVTEDEMDAMRRYVADWSKNSTLIPLRDEETGKLKYVDFFSHECIRYNYRHKVILIFLFDQN